MGEPCEVCITLDFLVKNSSLPLELLERGKEVKETSTLVGGHLNNEDVAKP
jgi:hypothetical protein